MSMIMAAINMRMETLLIPCIIFKLKDLGAWGSGFFQKVIYDAIFFRIIAANLAQMRSYTD